jgi:predicted O-methyltransferase YrrM
MELSDIASLARYLPQISDDRPEKLKKLPSAMDEYQTQFGRYYRFFWEMAKQWKPERVLEIGTYLGSSIAHFAAGNPAGLCVTIDCNPDATRIARELGYPNIVALTGDSSSMADEARKCGGGPYAPPMSPFDVLFIDGNHDFNHCYSDYIHYRPLMRNGGIILFDDITVGPEMEVAFSYIADKKMELNNLHWTGFGACKVDANITPRPLAEIIEEATKKFSR